MSRLSTTITLLAALLVLGVGALLVVRLSGSGSGASPDLSPIEISPAPAASGEPSETPAEGAPTEGGGDEGRFVPAPPELYELDDDDDDRPAGSRGGGGGSGTGDDDDDDDGDDEDDDEDDD
ncbi:hypothetical protein [Brevibacterium album]|uniref:hypothetical protein n=1 Tax=Brevibacterium album TaxID=417948 RepID=UPI0003FE6BA1|nr:hypothetical protein [Brevibacterium album]